MGSSPTTGTIFNEPVIPTDCGFFFAFQRFLAFILPSLCLISKHEKQEKNAVNANQNANRGKVDDLGLIRAPPKKRKRITFYQFLFEELVKRDFKKKYKRTVLGMGWSVLSPLLSLLVMRLVFTRFFGHTTPYYTTFLFCGNLVFSFFNESTSQGMGALVGNAQIFTKVNVPKYLFLFSKIVQCLLNFCLTLCVFFVFCALDHITFTWRFILLLYPIACLVLLNLGLGLILSALNVFFRDMQYLWSVFTQLLMYASAIFYSVDGYSPQVQRMFLANPMYLIIKYFRVIVIDGTLLSWPYHLLMAAEALLAFALGCLMYKKYNHQFLYYV